MVERVIEVSWLTASHGVMVLLVVAMFEAAWLLTALLWPVVMLFTAWTTLASFRTWTTLALNISLRLRYKHLV